MTAILPIIGASMNVVHLERQHNWLKEGKRDLELHDFADIGVFESDWRARAERARDLLDGHEGRVGIHGPFWGMSIAAHDPDIQAVVRNRLMQGLDACALLGGTHMVIHSPFTTWDHNNLDGKAGALEALYARCHQTIGDVVKRAEDIGVLLVVENIEDVDPRARLKLIESFQSDALAMSVDTGHAYYAHGSTGAPPVDYFIKAAGNKLAHVHLQDADGYADRHWAPGEGTLNWHAVFAALGELDGNPRLILELADVTKLQEAADWMIAHGYGR